MNRDQLVVIIVHVYHAARLLEGCPSRVCTVVGFSCG